MSIIDNMLVLLDDGGSKTIKEIEKIYSNRSRQILSSSLGRMVSKKWVIKNPQNNSYKITQTGQGVVTDNLYNIKRFSYQEKSGFCLFVTFKVNEKERIKRDILRTYLNNHGFGRLHNTVWVGLNVNLDNLKNLVKELNIADKLLIFKAKLDAANFERVSHYTIWNITQVNQEYKKFIYEAQIFLKLKNKDHVCARSFVYHFAKISILDPLLPTKILPKNYLGFKAFKLYEKIRSYCN